MNKREVWRQYGKGWLKLALKKWALSVVGWFYVPVLLARGVGMDTQPIWGNWEGIEPSHQHGRWKAYVWYAWRNPVHNLATKPMPEFTQYGNVTPEHFTNRGGVRKRMPGGDPMEQPGKWWRIRVSKDGQYASLRITFGPAMPNGKREFYVGHKMREGEKIMGFTFFQLRLGIIAAIKGLFK